MLNDPESGLQTNQREIFREYLGTDMGGVAPEGGHLNAWMQQLATGRPIEFKGRKLQLTADDKAQLIRAAYTGNEDAIEGIFENNMKRIDVDLAGLLEAATKSENLGAALNMWKDSLANSVSNFLYSKTEDSVKKVLGISDANWKAMDANQKHIAIARASQDYSNFESMLRGASEKINQELNAQLQDKVAAILRTRQNAQELVAKANEMRTNIQKEYQSAMDKAMNVKNVNISGGYNQAIAEEYKKRFQNEGGTGLNASYGVLLDAIAEGKLPPNTLDMLGQAGAILSQVRSLQSHPQGQAIAQQMINELNAMNTEGMRIGSDGVTTALNPVVIAKAGSPLVSKMQEIWDRGAAAFNQAVKDKITSEESAARKLYEGMMTTINQDVANAKGLLDKADKEDKIIAATNAQINQGVFAPKEIAELGMEQVRAMEQLGSTALKSIIGGYANRDELVKGSQSAYYDLGGRSGQATSGEIRGAKDQIAFQGRESGAAGLKAKDLNNITDIAPVAKPGVNVDWLADKRKLPELKQETPAAAPTVGGEKVTPAPVSEAPRTEPEYQKQKDHWTTAGAAQSGNMRMPNGGLVDGFYYKDPSTGKVHFVPNPESLVKNVNGLQQLGDMVDVTIGNWSPEAKDFWSKVPVVGNLIRDADQRNTERIATQKRIADIEAAIGEKRTNPADIAKMTQSQLDVMEKSAIDQQRTVVTQANNGKPIDGFDKLSPEGRAQLTREAAEKLKKEAQARQEASDKKREEEREQAKKKQEARDRDDADREARERRQEQESQERDNRAQEEDRKREEKAIQDATRGIMTPF